MRGPDTFKRSPAPTPQQSSQFVVQPPEDIDVDVYVGDPWRFPVLFLYASASFLGAAAFCSFAPIYSIVEARFDINAVAVNAVAISTFLTFIPGSFIALWFVNSFGPRANFLAGVISQLLSVFVKWAACVSSLEPHTAYAVLMVGQAIGGLGQPLIFNVITRLTMDWFPNNERDVATTVAFQSVGVGVIVFSILPPALVREPSQLSLLLYYQLLAWAALTVLSVLFFRESPPQPPSAAAAIQRAAREEEERALVVSKADKNAAVFSKMWRDFGTLKDNRNYMLLVTSYAFVQGMAYALPTLVGQFLAPCGYPSIVVGNAAAIFATFGIIGNVVVAPIMQATKQYRLLQQIVTAASAVGVCALLVSNRPDNLAGVYFAWGLMGLLQGPLGPLTLEHGVEITYPTSPENSTTFLSILSNLWNVLEIVVLSPLLELPVSKDCASTETPAAAASVGFLLIGLGCALFLQDDGRRGAAELEWKASRKSMNNMGFGTEAEPLLPLPLSRKESDAAMTPPPLRTAGSWCCVPVKGKASAR